MRTARCRSPTRMTLLLRLGDPPVPLPTGPVRPVRRDLRPVLHSVARPCRGGPAERFARCQAATPTSGQPGPARQPDDHDGLAPVQDIQHETLDGRWPSETWHPDDEPTTRAQVARLRSPAGPFDPTRQ